MDHPYYTVTVTNFIQPPEGSDVVITRTGWTYSSVEGEDWDPADDVVLISPLQYAWGFENEVLPAQMTPFVATVNLAARTAADVPPVQVGDLISIDVRVGTTGDRIIDPPPMRVMSVDVQLVTRGPYQARVSFQLSDITVDWRGKTLAGYPGGGANASMLMKWRERFAELGAMVDTAVVSPTWWADDEGPYLTGGVGNGLRGYYLNQVPDQGIDGFQRVLNSHMPDELTHTLTPVEGTPTGYEYVGPAAWDTDRTYSEPASAARAALVPASKRLPGSAGLPLEFAVDDGLLVVVPSTPPSGDSSTQLGLDAAWCRVPATAHRSVVGKIVRVEMAAQVNILQPDLTTYDSDGSLTYVVDQVGTGTTRQIPNDLYGGYDSGAPAPYLAFPTEAIVAAAPHFLSELAAVDAPWAYDAFEARSSLVPQDVADWLLPLLAPRVPGESDGDGRLIRNVTVFNLDHGVRLDGKPLSGFVTSGSLTISGGEITWSLTTLPGRPQWTDAAPTPVTVGDVQAAGYGTTSITQVDPAITIADLDYVDA